MAQSLTDKTSFGAVTYSAHQEAQARVSRWLERESGWWLIDCSVGCRALPYRMGNYDSNRRRGSDYYWPVVVSVYAEDAIYVSHYEIDTVIE